MAYFLQIEVDSTLSAREFRDRVIVPLGQALGRAGLGRILDADAQAEGTPEGVYELALEVTDQRRAREVVEAFLQSVDD